MVPLEDLQARGIEAEARVSGDPAGALAECLELLEARWVVDYDGYDDWLRTAGEALALLDQPVARALTFLARGDLGRTLDGLAADQAPLERAFVLERARRFDEAAGLYQRAGCWSRAAFAHERGGDWERATTAWESAVGAYPTEVDPERAVLAQLGHAQCLRARPSQAGEARRVLDAALMGLAGVAVAAEEAGAELRARRAYSRMACIGHEAGHVEHVLEGTVNLGRLLEDTGDLYGAVRQRLLGAGACVRAGEHHAAAVLLQLSARGARRTHPVLAAWCWRRAADAWGDAATRLELAGLLPGLIENALLAQLEALDQLGAGPELAAVARRLASHASGDRARARYERMAVRYGGASDAAPALPSFDALTLPPAPSRWAGSLAARELGGALRPALVERSILGGYPDLRRRALTAALRAYAGIDDDEAFAVEVAGIFGEGEGGESAQRALEILASDPRPVVRAAAVSALGGRPGHDAAELVVAAMEDLEPSVSAAAREALCARPRPDEIGIMARVAAQGSELAAGAAIDALALTGQDATWAALAHVAATRGDAAGEKATRIFELRCPEAMKPAYRSGDAA